MGFFRSLFGRDDHAGKASVDDGPGVEVRRFDPSSITYLVDDVSYKDTFGITAASIETFRETRDRFGVFTKAYLFYEESDSAQRFPPLSQVYEGQRGPNHWPRLVLEDERGDFMALTGCGCGWAGEGRTGAVTILREAGFSEAVTDRDDLAAAHLLELSPDKVLKRVLRSPRS